ncbi:MAG: hypothetical protein ACM3JG_09010 [Thiohalocapsa sp.]
MKLFQIEEPDGLPVDADAPGVAVGIDLSRQQAEIAVAVGGNASVVADRDGFEQDLAIPAADAPAEAWQAMFEGARLRAERSLARPVTHAVVVLVAPAEPAFAEKVKQAAAQAGIAVLDLLSPKALGAAPQPPVLAAAILAEDLAPRPPTPAAGP